MTQRHSPVSSVCSDVAEGLPLYSVCDEMTADLSPRRDLIWSAVSKPLRPNSPPERNGRSVSAALLRDCASLGIIHRYTCVCVDVRARTNHHKMLVFVVSR